MAVLLMAATKRILGVERGNLTQAGQHRVKRLPDRKAQNLRK